MDFHSVLKSLVHGFDREDVAYAMMGGFALGLWGVQRATVDLDFLVRKADLPRVHAIMTGMNYHLLHQSENVSQYVSDLRVFGEVDYLHAFREATTHMLARAATKPLFGGVLEIPVLLPEDLIGLKVQAFVNDPSRSRDRDDIIALMDRHGNSMDWTRIEGYFALFERLDLLAELRKAAGL
ncbi:MAG: hypothetical protein U5S82_24030 [Gammaproteobacteria bacterium]|nr:hypothetical protein [Gammaproteobacteria bacterium]